MDNLFFHIDVNSAYLSWTSVENLKTGNGEDLRLIPSIIGGDSSKRHGVVLAKSIPAKKYHVETGEPIVNALRKCPSLVIAPPDHALYQHYSDAMMAHLANFCPDLEQVSVDECFMDYTPIAERYPSPEKAAQIIKDSIKNAFGFTVNIGISDRKVLAKMASDFRKPDLVHTLYKREIAEKMWPLPVGSLFLCGRSSTAVLNKLGIRTIGDLASCDPAILLPHLKSHGQTLWNYANGIDDSVIITTQAQAKGIGNSITLSADATSKAQAAQTILSLAETVAARLRKAGMQAGNVSLEIKYATFQTVSHQTILPSPCDTADQLYQTGMTLFDELWNGDPIRLLGLRTAKLTDDSEPVQLSLFDFVPQTAGNEAGNDTETSASYDIEKHKRLDRALDDIRSRYGQSSVVRGTFYKADQKQAHQKGNPEN